MASKLPEKITDIKTAEELDKVINAMAGRNSVNGIFTIENGYIYTPKDPSLNSKLNMLFIQLDDMQYLYESYIKCATNQTKSTYSIGFNHTKIVGREYFKLGGSFKLINLSTSCGIYEENDLIFTSPLDNYYIVQIEANYYCVPKRPDQGETHHLSHILRIMGGIPYTPIKSIFKFKKLMKMSGEIYFKHDYNYRHVVDFYNADCTFLCADTFDIVNPETGKRVQTWPLKVVRNSFSLKLTKKFVDEHNYIWPPEITNNKTAHLLHDEHWGLYYIVNDGKFYELRSRNSGKVTKAAAAEAE